MSSAIAARERRPHVPGTPKDRILRAKELQQLEEKQKIKALLSGWNIAMQHQAKQAKDAFAFLLVLDLSKRQLRIIAFKEDQAAVAQAEYLAKEKETEGNQEIQVVLVSVDSVEALRRAYPNYYMDTSAFITAIDLELKGIGDEKPSTAV